MPSWSSDRRFGKSLDEQKRERDQRYRDARAEASTEYRLFALNRVRVLLTAPASGGSAATADNIAAPAPRVGWRPGPVMSQSARIGQHCDGASKNGCAPAQCVTARCPLKRCRGCRRERGSLHAIRR